MSWAFTDRAGGSSSGDFDSLNLGGHVGDDAAAVEANREAVAGATGVGARPPALHAAVPRGGRRRGRRAVGRGWPAAGRRSGHHDGRAGPGRAGRRLHASPPRRRRRRSRRCGARRPAGHDRRDRRRRGRADARARRPRPACRRRAVGLRPLLRGAGGAARPRPPRWRPRRQRVRGRARPRSTWPPAWSRSSWRTTLRCNGFRGVRARTRGCSPTVATVAPGGMPVSSWLVRRERRRGSARRARAQPRDRARSRSRPRATSRDATPPRCRWSR